MGNLIGLEKTCVFCGMLFTIKSEGYKDICRRCVADDDQNKPMGFVGAAIPKVDVNRDWLKEMAEKEVLIYGKFRRN